MTHPCVRKPRRRTPVQPPGRGLRSASISTGHSACLPLRAHPLHLRSAPSPVRGLTALPPVTLAAKSAPRRIRRCLPAARGAARRLFRSRRRDALGGGRLRRLCAAASHSRLAVPTSSPSASHAGGVPSWARREWRRRRIRGETRRVPPPGALREARPTPSGAGSAEARRGGGARPAGRQASGGGWSEGRVIAPRPAARCRRTRCEPQSAASMAGGGATQDAPSKSRLSSGTPCAAIGFRRKASCRASLDARRGTRRADWTGVRPPGLRAQPGARIARRGERADGRAPGGEADSSLQTPQTPLRDTTPKTDRVRENPLSR